MSSNAVSGILVIHPWLVNENLDLLTGWMCSLVKITSIIMILCLFEQCDNQLSLIKYSDYQSVNRLIGDLCNHCVLCTS